jgi:hypothetical protein
VCGPGRGAARRCCARAAPLAFALAPLARSTLAARAAALPTMPCRDLCSLSRGHGLVGARAPSLRRCSARTPSLRRCRCHVHDRSRRTRPLAHADSRRSRGAPSARSLSCSPSIPVYPRPPSSTTRFVSLVFYHLVVVPSRCVVSPTYSLCPAARRYARLRARPLARVCARPGLVPTLRCCQLAAALILASINS